MSEAERICCDLKRRRLFLTGGAWIVLTVISGVRNLAATFCTPYFDVWSWILTGACLISLLLFDVTLYQVRHRTAQRLLLWYWGVGTLLLGFLQFYPSPEGYSEAYQLLGWLGLLLTPYFPLLTVTYAVARRFRWDDFELWGAVAVCVAQFVFIFLLDRHSIPKPTKEGGADGFMDL